MKIAGRSVLALVLVSFCLFAVAEPLSEVEQVTNAEQAFAKTMADRNFSAFTEFLSTEAIFFSGEKALRGKQQIIEVWAAYYEGEVAPFSWEPDQVEVLESGKLALSTGPVFDPNGKIIGRFNSIWRQQANAVWRVVFDKGSPVCPEPQKDKQE